MAGFRLNERWSIVCGIAGDMIEIHYESAAGEVMRRIVTIADLFEYAGDLYIDGFCHLRGEDRTFRLGAVHFLSELPLGGYFQSVRKWLATYGVEVDLYEHRGVWRYRVTNLGPP